MTETLQEKANGGNIGAILLKIALRIQELWQLSPGELSRLLGVTIATTEDWRTMGQIPRGDALVNQRVWHLIMVYKSLASYLSAAADQILWLRSPHQAFTDRSPLSVALDDGPDGLTSLVAYLCYGHFGGG